MSGHSMRRRTSSARERLMPYVVGLTYAPAGDSDPGRLLFVREGTLIAQPFDHDTAGAGRESCASRRASGLPFVTAVSSRLPSNDVLVYRTDRHRLPARLVRSAGSRRVRPGNRVRFAARRSPLMVRARSRRARTRRTRRRPTCGCSICARRGGATRLTFDAGLAEFPVWSRDGKRVVFTVNNSALHQKLTSGEGDAKEVLHSISAGLHHGGGLVARRTIPSVRHQRGHCHADGPLGASLGRSQTGTLHPIEIHREDQGGSRRTDDGWPTSRINPARWKCTSAHSRRDFSGGSAGTGGSVADVAWRRHRRRAGVAMAGSCSIWRLTGR